LALYYDSEILDRVPAVATLVADCTRYSVWHKPPGLLVEGSRYGDHATLLHQVERHFQPARRVWLIHRLDLEAAGLMVIAHTPQAAAHLSAQFQNRSVHKQYYIEVAGQLGHPDAHGRFDLPLDGKAAITDYRVMAVDVEHNLTHVEVTMLSGRYHQIRRHFAAAGHPVLGDPKYGHGNSHVAGMRLVAVLLRFVDPWQQTAVAFSIAAETRARWGWYAV
jgi:tRNA pseudouridine32 synthase/23S rRNA pseudouridine746 synthase